MCVCAHACVFAYVKGMRGGAQKWILKSQILVGVQVRLEVGLDQDDINVKGENK